MKRKVNRRSFLARVVGGAVAGGGALLTLSGRAGAHSITDQDEGATSDPAGAGRGIGAYSDADAGANSDPRGQGSRWGHFSDSDSGEGADPANHGRRRMRGQQGGGTQQPECVSDSDSGMRADPACEGGEINRGSTIDI